ncbi:MAG: GNAT family N-acetyltransferase [Microscillaceae bacterium]
METSPPIHYTQAQSRADLQQILALQARNLRKNVSPEEAVREGFLSVEHDLDTLEEMAIPHPHILAKSGDRLAGYALVMLRRLESKIPMLQPMFENINRLDYRGHSLRAANYCVMGQICIDQAFRGQGIFRGLYQTFQRQLAPHFEYLLTEVATRNTRSMRAHAQVGFQMIHQYTTPEEEWAIILWDWRNPNESRPD